ncbi:hypothetical protein SCLCIDRAFT_1212292 [Scleroderma citrinum Foug A]|uniref:Uncharacterized protein n=1 Tax=Scleroderma citrinum Foug A TaxID=1036808 RepID=A0A0C3EB28_9AGAM|nr:hypothetical protein SCLCIDRAFT_1212292 [Scleroderma citrinum Foug A]
MATETDMMEMGGLLRDRYLCGYFQSRRLTTPTTQSNPSATVHFDNDTVLAIAKFFVVVSPYSVAQLDQNTMSEVCTNFIPIQSKEESARSRHQRTEHV